MPLTFWEKILKLFGLYKAPTRPPRRQSAPAAKKQPKSNTRDTRGAKKPAAKKAARPKSTQPKAAPAKAFEGEFPVETARLYVGNLSYDVTEHDLEDLFKGIGTVRKVEIVYNRQTHRSKGYAFLQMLSVDEAKRAVEVLHDQPFMGRVLIVNGASSKPKDKNPSPNKPRPDSKKEEEASE